MTGFSHVEALIPESLAIPAAMVGRALDGDIGGAENFEANVFADALGSHFRYASIRGVSIPYAQGMRGLLANPSMLLATIQLDTDLRFPGANVPTLEQCEAFCAACVVSIDGDAPEILSGLTPVTRE